MSFPEYRHTFMKICKFLKQTWQTYQMVVSDHIWFFLCLEIVAINVARRPLPLKFMHVRFPQFSKQHRHAHTNPRWARGIRQLLFQRWLLSMKQPLKHYVLSILHVRSDVICHYRAAQTRQAISSIAAESFGLGRNSYMIRAVDSQVAFSLTPSTPSRTDGLNVVPMLCLVCDFVCPDMFATQSATSTELFSARELLPATLKQRSD